MTTKKTSAATQLKHAKAEIVALTEALKKAEDSAKRHESNLVYANKAREKAEEEVEQLHQFFDSLPGGIPRKTEEGYSGKENKAMTRLCAWLATK